MIPGARIIDDILSGLPENARLRSELTKLVAENEALKLEVKNQTVEIEALKYKYESQTNRFTDEQRNVLKILATEDQYWLPSTVSAALGIDVVRVHSLLAKLKLSDYVFQSHEGYHINSKGRAALL